MVGLDDEADDALGTVDVEPPDLLAFFRKCSANGGGTSLVGTSMSFPSARRSSLSLLGSYEVIVTALSVRPSRRSMRANSKPSASAPLTAGRNSQSSAMRGKCFTLPLTAWDAVV